MVSVQVAANQNDFSSNAQLEKTWQNLKGGKNIFGSMSLRWNSALMQETRHQYNCVVCLQSGLKTCSMILKHSKYDFNILWENIFDSSKGYFMNLQYNQ